MTQKYNLRRANTTDIPQGVRKAYRYFLKLPGTRVRIYTLQRKEPTPTDDVMVIYVQEHDYEHEFLLTSRALLFVQGFPMWEGKVHMPQGSIGFPRIGKLATRAKWLLEDCPLINPEGRQVDYDAIRSCAEMPL